MCVTVPRFLKNKYSTKNNWDSRNHYLHIVADSTVHAFHIVLCSHWLLLPFSSHHGDKEQLLLFFFKRAQKHCNYTSIIPVNDRMFSDHWTKMKKAEGEKTKQFIRPHDVCKKN